MPSLTLRVQKKDILMFLKMFSTQFLSVLSGSYLSSLKDGLGSKGVVQSPVSMGPQCHMTLCRFSFLQAFNIEEVLCGNLVGMGHAQCPIIQGPPRTLFSLLQKAEICSRVTRGCRLQSGSGLPGLRMP